MPASSTIHCPSVRACSPTSAVPTTITVLWDVHRSLRSQAVGREAACSPLVRGSRRLKKAMALSVTDPEPRTTAPGYAEIGQTEGGIRQIRQPPSVCIPPTAEARRTASARVEVRSLRVVRDDRVRRLLRVQLELL